MNKSIMNKSKILFSHLILKETDELKEAVAAELAAAELADAELADATGDLGTEISSVSDEVKK